MIDDNGYKFFEKESKIKRCCVTCDRNQRIERDDGYIDCVCAIDGHSIGYVECFESACRRYALDKEYKPGGKWYEEEVIHGKK